MAALALLLGPVPGARAQSPASGREVYAQHQVHAGESLHDIAAQYRMGTTELARLNGRRLGDLLWPGQSLRIPLTNVRGARASQFARASSGRLGTGAHGASANPATAATATPAPEVAAAGDSATRYTVQPGDTLSGIAANFGTDVDSLIRVNGLPLDGYLQAGTTLNVDPAAAQDSRAPAVTEPGESGRPKPLTASSRAYTVVAGDTLTSVAAKFGETATAIQRLNGLVDDAIYEGQTLLLPVQGLGPSAAAAGAKRIVIDVSEQRMYVWQGDRLVWNLVASTGLDGYVTQRGSFKIQSKIPNAWSSAWQLWMPFWLGIYWAGGSENGIHALPIINGQKLWEGYLGSPISYGCVVLSTEDAERLYNWVDIGTPVEIRD